MSSSSLKTTSAVITPERKAAPWGYYFYCELMKILRNPPTVFFGICFPTLFFLIFDNMVSGPYASALLASYAAYGAFIVSFQTFSISLSSERAMGWNRLMRTTPLTVTLYLLSKFLMVIIVGILSMLLLFFVAALSGKVSMPLQTWAALLGMMIVGMTPLSLMGLFLGFVGSTNLTQVLATLLMLVMSFASGLWIPLSLLPDGIQKVAPYLPSYHLGQLAWITVGTSYSRDNLSLGTHLLVLGIYAVIFLALASWAYIRDENKNFS